MFIIFYRLIYIPVHNYIFHINDTFNANNAATKSKEVKNRF